MHNESESYRKKIVDEQDRLAHIPVLERDTHPTPQTGVLLSNYIQYYAQKHNMIDPFNEDNLKPAAYELTVGDEFYINREFHSLTTSEAPPHPHAPSEIVIEPFNVAVIKTRETIVLPRFIIARWNLRVRHAYSGLLWVGAAQVDPGYKGHLFCPLYNLSDKPVRLKSGEEIAVIDFVRTTDFEPSECKPYRDKPKRPIIQSFGIGDFQSALITHAVNRLNKYETELESFKKDVESRASRLEERANHMASTLFVVIGIIVSALAVLATFSSIRNPYAKPTDPWWIALPTAISVCAILFSLARIPLDQEQSGFKYWSLWLIASVLIALAVFAGAVIFIL